MHCRQTEQRLHALLDSRQDIDHDDQLRAHLETCDRCATLAAAYVAAVRRPTTPVDTPIINLADRVIAKVMTASPPRRNGHWRVWGTLALAASLLVAVGVALYRHDQPAPPPTAPPVVASQDLPAPGSLVAVDPAAVDDAVREIAGREVWYRTGLSVASISLEGLRWQRATTSESDTPSDQQLLDRAMNTFRTLWPGEGESTTPNQNKTGWQGPTDHVLIA